MMRFLKKKTKEKVKVLIKKNIAEEKNKLEKKKNASTPLIVSFAAAKETTPLIPETPIWFIHRLHRMVLCAP